MNKTDIDKERTLIAMYQEFFSNWGVGVGTSVRVRRNDHQFKITDKGIIEEIVSVNLASIKFEGIDGRGTFHMENLEIIT